MSWVATIVQTTFRSLRVRNFRLYFVGQGISMTGTWMQSVAQMWLVLQITGSGVALGVTAALQSLPMLLFGTWGGMVADRSDKRHVLFFTQSAAALQAIGLAVLTLTGNIQLWMVYVFALGLGFVNCIDNPTRQSLVVEMVGRQQTANAVSVNTAMFTTARVIGPAIGGLVVSEVGSGWAFLINAASFLAVLASLTLMRPAEFHRSVPIPRGRGQIREGMRYAWNSPPIRLSLLIMAVAGTLAFNFGVVLPLMTNVVFHSGAQTFGVLMSLIGVGALVGALITASITTPTPRILLGGAAAFGLVLIAAAAVPTLQWEMVMMVPMGISMILYQVTSNAIIQVNAEPSFRGRVLSLYIVLFLGTTPIGGPLVGWIGQHFGPRASMAVGGVAVLAAAVVGMAALARRGELRAEGPVITAREQRQALTPP